MSFFKKKHKESAKETPASEKPATPAPSQNQNAAGSVQDFGAPSSSAMQPPSGMNPMMANPALSSSYGRSTPTLMNGMPPPNGSLSQQPHPPPNVSFNPSRAPAPPSTSQPAMSPHASQPGPPGPDRPRSQAPGQSANSKQNIIYPWSHRPFNFLAPATAPNESPSTIAGREFPAPFPRYGHSASALANERSNDMYIFGGLVNDRPSSDLFIMSCLPNSTSAINAYKETHPGATDLPQPGSLNIQWAGTVGEIPSPRLGHTSVGLGNVLIVWGGDTSTTPAANDMGDSTVANDDALYLLNLGTREWTRVGAVGPRPVGRYGHAAAIVGSKFFVFGGQSSDSVFLNDLWCFDLQMLKGGKAHWVQLQADNPDSTAREFPSQRTGHTLVAHNDCLYVFGGTDGSFHYNDTWEYSTMNGNWAELQCTGYIPSPREGHAATLVDDVMYVFAGRGVDGRDLEDLAAFKITGPEGVARRWFMFQHMGPTPSGRSGHAMATWNSKVFVLGGESYNGATYDPNFLNILDTSKIKYPSAKPGQNRKSAGPGQSAEEAARRATSPTGGRPPNGLTQSVNGAMNGPSRAQADPRGQMPVRPPREDEHASLSRSASPSSPTQSRPLQSLDAQVAGRTSQDQQLPYPGVTQRSPPQQQQTLQDQPKSPPAEAQTQSVPNAAPELARSAHPSDKWLLAALSEAHSSGFRPSDSQVQRALDTLRSEKSTATSDQQLMSIIVSLKEELANAKASVSDQSHGSHERMRSLESSRSAAVKEASYLKAKLAAIESGSTADVGRLDREKLADLERQFAQALDAKKSLEAQHQQLSRQIEDERRLKESAVTQAQEANARADASESSYSRSLSDFADLQKRFHAHDGTVKDHSRDLHALRSQHDSLQAEHDDAKARLGASEGSLDTYLRSLSDSKVALESINSELAEMQSQCQTAKTDLASSQSELQSLRAEYDAKVLENSQQSAKIEELEHLLTIVRQEKEALTTLTSGSLAELLAVTKDNKSRETQMQTLAEQKLAAIGSERDNYRDLHDQVRSGASSSQAELDQARARSNDLELQLVELKRTLSSLTTKHQDAQDQISQLHGQLASHVTTMDQHTTKLEAEESRSTLLRSILADHGLSEESAAGEGSPNGNEAINLRRRVQDLERHLDHSQRSAAEQTDQLRQQLAEQRALSPSGTSRDQATEAELAQLQERHRGLVESHGKAVQYVKGTEKMLRRMKDQLNASKARVEELENELASGSGGDARSEVDAMKTQVSDLLRMSEQARQENKGLSDRLATVKGEFQQTLRQREAQSDKALQDVKQQSRSLQEQLNQASHELAELKRGDGGVKSMQAANDKIEELKKQNETLEDRCRQAESRVGLLLDHFEKGDGRSETSSVDDFGSRTSGGSEFATDRIGALLNSASHSNSYDPHSLDSEELRSTFWKSDRQRDDRVQ